MLQYPKEVSLVTVKKRFKKVQNSFTNLIQYNNGICPSVISCCICTAATVSRRQATKPCSIAMNSRDFNFNFQFGR